MQPPTLFEEFKDDHVAFIGEGSVDVVADILPSVSLRVGYEVLFLNELVLAGDNFNQTSPYGNQGPRVPFVDTTAKCSTTVATLVWSTSGKQHRTTAIQLEDFSEPGGPPPRDGVADDPARLRLDKARTTRDFACRFYGNPATLDSEV